MCLSHEYLPKNSLKFILKVLLKRLNKEKMKMKYCTTLELIRGTTIGLAKTCHCSKTWLLLGRWDSAFPQKQMPAYVGFKNKFLCKSGERGPVRVIKKTKKQKHKRAISQHCWAPPTIAGNGSVAHRTFSDTLLSRGAGQTVAANQTEIKTAKLIHACTALNMYVCGDLHRHLLAGKKNTH